ncbi:MAG: hypothetical protein U0169_08240 [Polyangiaceae bacterium]
MVFAGAFVFAATFGRAVDFDFGFATFVPLFAGLAAFVPFAALDFATAPVGFALAFGFVAPRLVEAAFFAFFLEPTMARH